LKLHSIPFLLVLLFPLASALAIGPDKKALLLDSVVYEEKHDLGKAVEKMSQALKGNEDDYFLNFRLAGLYAQEKKFKNAETHYLRAASAAPRSLEPLLALSLQQYNLGAFADAANTGLKILALDPANYSALQRVIGSQIKTKAFDEALAHAKEAVKFYPSDTAFLEQKGYIEVALKLPEGKATLNQLLLIAPRNNYARTLLGEMK
jgi:tetratricopeptide (TPR) repeat protein